MNPNQIPLFYLNHRTLSVNKVHAVDNSCPYARRRRPPPGPHGGQDSYDEAVICDCGAHKLIALIEDEVLADERPRTRQHLTTLRYNIAARLPCEVTYGFEYGKLMIRWKLRGVTVGREEFLVRVLEVEGRGFDRDDDEVKFSNVTEEEVEREAKAESDDVDFEEEDEGGKGGGGGGDDSIQNGALQSDGGGLENASMQNTDGETAELNVRGHGDDLDQNPDRDQSPSGTPGENASSTKLEDHDQSDADTESVSGVDIMEGHEFIRTSEDFWIFDDYKPATQYVVQIRADNAKAFFSVPFYFSIPPRPPANVSVSQQQQQQDSSLVQVIWDASEGADSYLVVFDDVDKESFEVDNGETRWSGIPPQGATHITVYSRCTALEHQSSGTTQPLRAPTPIPVPEPEVQPVSNSAEPILGPPVTDVIDAEPERESGGAHVPAEASQHEPGTSGRESAQTLVDTTSTMGSDDSAERSSAPSQQGFGTPSRQSTQTLVNATSAMDSDDGYDSDNEPFRSTFPSNSMDIDESILSFHMPPTFVPGESRGSRTDVDMPVPDEEPFERSESTNKRKRRPSLSRPSSPASPEPRRRRIDESAPFARIGDAEDLPDDYEGDSLDLESDGEHEEEEEILMMKTSLSEINVVQDSSAETTQASKQTNLSYHTVRGVQVTPGLIVQCSGPSGPSLIGQVRRITKKGTSVWIETVLYKPCKSHFTGWEDDRHLVLDVAFAAGPFNGVDSLPAIALEDDWFSHVERAKYQKIIHTNHTSASVDDSSFICPWAYISGEGHASYIRPILEVPSECTTQVRAKSLSAVNIFCGAGGVSVGFSQAGFNTVLGVDKDSSAISTFQRNFNSARVHFQPSEDFLADVLEKKLESPMPSVLIISPPCQSLESEGKHNRLTESIGAALQAYQPPYCVLFNANSKTI
ncbi:hypothetical protein GYMLUDRAFT_843437 [Collybiopsis luxurians FD-317 M1]|uniref:DNA (cytosine-5-)-methyltransferase n=1 Tax=Collybiopsis luxurians FD-317 M1 TaxID=944289 RepID=A0A0D0BZK5_9AGAR|nr:hypothetical protein GYMLUDRAFT_843437 [Collybiopsis luxurians FD-317 M1]